jgi:hypothetical protein
VQELGREVSGESGIATRPVRRWSSGGLRRKMPARSWRASILQDHSSEVLAILRRIPILRLPLLISALIRT